MALTKIRNTNIEVGAIEASALELSGVTAGSYGSASAVPVITVNAHGLVTGVTTTAVAGVSNVTYNTSTGILTIDTSNGSSYSVDLSVGSGDTLSLTGLSVTNTITGTISSLSNHTTTGLAEGTNQYFTTARARASISATGSLSYNSTTGVISFTQGNTDTVAEGSTNLYYTDARVGSYLTANSYATQSYVSTALANLVDSAPSTLDTLNELAAALGDDPNFATTISTQISTKLNSTDFTKANIDSLGINATTLDSLDSTRFLQYGGQDITDTNISGFDINFSNQWPTFAFGGTTSAAVTLKKSGSLRYSLSLNSDDTFSLYNYGTMSHALTVGRFTSNFGIGITDPQAKLHVNGSSILGGTETDNFVTKFGTQDTAIYVGGSNTNTINVAYGYNGDNYNLHINYNGYLGGDTKTRNLIVNDGKHGNIAKFDGNNHQTSFYGNVIPDSNAAYDLGSATNAWRNVYTNDLHLSNEGHEEGNSVDGTKGNWTIQEGTHHLYILNNKTGKKYRFALEEIL